MKNLFKLLIKVALAFLLIVLIVLGGFITYAFMTDYKPEPKIQLTIDQGTLQSTITTDKPYSILTYNIGYGALGKDQDFFMDGGRKAGADSYDEVMTNMEAIDQFFLSQNPDFAFFQEVDISGNRSFDVNQYDLLRKNEYNGIYAPNYKVKYVPVPFTHPMGGAESGIVTLSKSIPSQSERYRF
ncbi:endonuclease, partial [Erysipelothrix rhusiopathiae]|nr:endonuclease [Erysipelothrix rhusiopathiae]